jgi:hypothetical protein
VVFRPEHESGVRSMWAEAHGGSYAAVRSLAEAQALHDGAVVLEGDWGGQIYATVPARLVRCDEQALERLLRDLDPIAWPGNEEDGARVFYERVPVGGGVAGGMGGAVVMDGVWVHEEFESLGLADAIGDVIAGERERIPLTEGS